jgi:hypothetical protein
MALWAKNPPGSPTAASIGLSAFIVFELFGFITGILLSIDLR